MATSIEYIDGRKVYTSTNTISSESPIASISFSVALGDEEEGGSAVPSTTTDDRLSLAGLLAEEVDRYKLTLKNKLLFEMDNSIVSPSVSEPSPFISQMNYSNQLKAQKEQREILMANVDKEYKKTDIEIKLKDLELKKEQNLQNDAILTMMGESYVQNQHILNTLGGVRSSIGAVLNKITAIHNDQKATNAKIVENLDKQNTKLDKQVEHFAFQKEGTPDLKDSNGNIIKPREVEAKNNAEHHIDKKSFNEFDSSVLIDSLDEIDKDFDSDVETIKNLFSSILVLDKDKFKTELNQNIFKVAP